MKKTKIKTLPSRGKYLRITPTEEARLDRLLVRGTTLREVLLGKHDSLLDTVKGDKP